MIMHCRAIGNIKEKKNLGFKSEKSRARGNCEIYGNFRYSIKIKKMEVVCE